jgi:hypothetical protein
VQEDRAELVSIRQVLLLRASNALAEARVGLICNDRRGRCLKGRAYEAHSEVLHEQAEVDESHTAGRGGRQHQRHASRAAGCDGQRYLSHVGATCHQDPLRACRMAARRLWAFAPIDSLARWTAWAILIDMSANGSFERFEVRHRCPVCKSVYVILIVPSRRFACEIRGPGCPSCDWGAVGDQPATDVGEANSNLAAGGLELAIHGGDATLAPDRRFEVGWAGGDGFTAYEADGSQCIPIGSTIVDRERAAANVAIDLVENGVVPVVGEQLAELFADPVWKIVEARWRPERCLVLESFAGALDAIRTELVSGVAAVVRVTVRLTGAPELFAVLAGEVVARAFAGSFLHPLTSMSYFLRVSGTIACAADGCLPECRCAIALGKQLSIDGLAEMFERALERELPDPSGRDALPAFVVLWGVMEKELALRSTEPSPHVDAPATGPATPSPKPPRRRIRRLRPTEASGDNPERRETGSLGLLATRVRQPLTLDDHGSESPGAQAIGNEPDQAFGLEPS